MREIQAKSSMTFAEWLHEMRRHNPNYRDNSATRTAYAIDMEYLRRLTTNDDAPTEGETP